jgi:hypothetical protein
MPVTHELEDRDGGGGELFSHTVKHGRRRGISGHARDDRRSGGHQREREFWDRGIMADDQKRSASGGAWRIKSRSCAAEAWYTPLSKATAGVTASLA